MTLRRAVVGDHETLVRMGLAFYASSPYAGQLEVTADSLAALVAFLVEPNDHQVGTLVPRGAAFLLEVDGVAVGMIAALALPNHLTMRVHVAEVAFYVEPKWRLADVWQDLVDEFEAWAEAQRAEWTELIEPPGCPAVGRLYRRRGYAPFETVWRRRVS